MSVPPTPFEVHESGALLHGTKADLQVGDLLGPGRRSNFGQGRTAGFVYVTATLDAATWGAELAVGEGRGRIYVVEPTGELEDDPNLTNTRFPGNPTRSYRTREPVRVVGEITDWVGHPPEQLQAMRDRVAQLAREGVEAIED
ncbi:NAD(+)--rifampin ADP-ribosyltransferase [Cellulomonas soli]|uniref:NAD(+)--rifampin ADP-ribosyltransferase n=1 Tax=Cellulomonas soli TaxID=931535 RepID=A0A512PDF7_9CELL|nr:NAD(+)--rifampin ADP-ribosyltransferase [Cellulomonas soli]NYI60102.1 rifampin ADP-ribosylating transferase [Cellulomonas soli]GEP69245.1 NAD(+)--rifampin ADP-ribosyltransferase [Cellulomonas soli]